MAEKDYIFTVEVYGSGATEETAWDRAKADVLENGLPGYETFRLRGETAPVPIKHQLNAVEKLKEAVTEWPEFEDPTKPVDPGELTTWFGGYRDEVKDLLATLEIASNEALPGSEESLRLAVIIEDGQVEVYSDQDRPDIDVLVINYDMETEEGEEGEIITIDQGDGIFEDAIVTLKEVTRAEIDLDEVFKEVERSSI
jgi:hypothetical protein